MSDPEEPQIYLALPSAFDLSTFPKDLSAALDRTEVACLRLRHATTDLDMVARMADAVRPVAHHRDIALVIDTHVALAERLGLDGVHLPDTRISVRDARKTLGQDAIVGAFCGTSRHDGLTLGEAGADYISFGPVASDLLGPDAIAGKDLFAWWSEMIELPVVAEGGLNDQTLRALSPVVDFFALGDEVWSHEDPAARLADLAGFIG